MKTRARDLRWKEELLLVEEEMRRTLVTLEYEAKEWISQVAPETVERSLGEGLTAYALRQAAIRRALASKFQKMWNAEEPDETDKAAEIPAPVSLQGSDSDTDNDDLV
jgi:hypothetical protein